MMTARLYTKRVDGWRNEALLRQMHDEVFKDAAPLPETVTGTWWLVYDDGTPIAFAGLIPDEEHAEIGYLYRCGVLPSHRGRGLQGHLIRVRERYARKLGLRFMTSDTSIDNVPSSNNLINNGYSMFTPAVPWALDYSVYWIKAL